MPFAWLEFLDNLWDAQSEFRYVERGKMASMGMWGGVADLTKSEITPVGGTLTGVTAFASWRGAYAVLRAEHDIDVDVRAQRPGT